MRAVFEVVAAGALTALVALSGCSRRAPEGVGAAEDESPASLRTPKETYGEANWDLDADPASVPLHQRTDPTTGRTIELTKDQARVSKDAPASRLDQARMASGELSTEPRVTTGEPDESGQELVR